MTNYCSRFIPDYATKTEPRRKLTYKDQPWCRTTVHDRAVSQLKEALACAPVTACFDSEKESEMSVDGSPVGLVAILSQVDSQTEGRHVITYASRSLTATEQRYNQREREALAVVCACEHLHLYVYGKPITVYTGYKPLVAIYSNPSSRGFSQTRLQSSIGEVKQTQQITCRGIRQRMQPKRHVSRKLQRSISIT